MGERGTGTQIIPRSSGISLRHASPYHKRDGIKTRERVEMNVDCQTSVVVTTI